MKPPSQSHSKSERWDRFSEALNGIVYELLLASGYVLVLFAIGLVVSIL